MRVRLSPGRLAFVLTIGGTLLSIVTVAFDLLPLWAVVPVVVLSAGITLALSLERQFTKPAHGPISMPARLVHRDAEVSEALDTLRDQHRLYLYGASGNGKTVLAALIAQRWDGGAVFVEGADHIGSLAAHARAKGLVSDQADDIQSAARMRDELDTATGQQLLIADSVGPNSSIHALLPRSNSVNVVVVGDNLRDSPKGFIPQHVGPLSIDEAARLFSDRPDPEHRALADWVGGHPASCDLLARHLAEYGISPSELLVELREESVTVTASLISLLPQISAAHAAVRRALMQQREATTLIIDLLAVAKVGLSKPFVQALARAAGHGTAEVIGSVDRLERLTLVDSMASGREVQLRTLPRLSLGEHPGTRSGDNLLKALTRVTYDLKGSDASFVHDAFVLFSRLADLRSMRSEDFHEAAVQLCLNSEAASGSAALEGLQFALYELDTSGSIERYSIALQAARIAHDLARYRDAAQILSDVLYDESDLSADVAVSLGSRLCDNLYHLGMHRKAGDFIRRLSDSVGSCASSSELAYWFWQVGRHNAAQGRWLDARGAFDMCLAEEERAYGAGHWRTLWTHIELARVSHELGDDDTASLHYQRVTDLAIAVDPSRATQLLTEAGLGLARLGFDTQAKGAFLEVRDFGHAFGDYRAVSDALFRIGDLHHDLGQFSRAKEFFEAQVRFVDLEAHQHDGRRVAARLNLAMTMAATNRPAVGLRIIDEVDKIQASGGPKSSARSAYLLAQRHSTFGYCNHLLGDYPTAVQSYELAGRLYKPTRPEERRGFDRNRRLLHEARLGAFGGEQRPRA